MNSDSVIDLLITLLLGATTGGAAVFLLIRNKLKSADPAGLRRVALLEQVAQHIGRVAYVFGKYTSLVSEIGPRTGRMSARQERELDDISNQLVAVYEEAAIAESKLLLLGEQRLEKALKLYTAKMAQFRKQVYPGRYHNAEDAARLQREVVDMRDQFYNILSERYDQKIT